MKIITSIFKWMVFSNVWVSLGVLATTYVGMKLDIVPFDLVYCFIAGSATLFAYNIQRIFKFREGIPSPSVRHIWIGNNRNVILFFSLVGITLCCILALYTLTLKAVLSSIPFVILVLLYAYSIGKIKALRLIPFVKIVIISAVWTWTIVVLPILNKGVPFKLNHWGYVSFIFLFVFALCIPFDIRDLENDRSNIKTLPSAIGKRSALVVSLVSLFACLYISFYFRWLELETIVFIASIILLFGNERRNELYFTGLLDGMFLLLYGIYLLYSVIL